MAQDELLPRAIAVAGQLAGLNMDAHKQTKARIREDLNMALATAIEKELGSPG